MRHVLATLVAAIITPALSPAQEVQIEGKIYIDSRASCCLLYDVETRRMYELFGGDADLCRAGIQAVVSGYSSSYWPRRCRNTTLFTVLSYEILPPSPWWTPSLCAIRPIHPTSDHSVTITFSGTWGSTCVPNRSRATVVDDTIQLDAIRHYSEGAICLAAPTPWSLSENVGPLEAGTYVVKASLVDNTVQVSGLMDACTLVVIDNTIFADCMMGPAVGVLPDCEPADLNADDVVDLRDYQDYQRLDQIAPHLGSYTDVGCYYDTDATCVDNDAIELTINPAIVRLTHHNATYIWAEEIEVLLSIDGSTLRVTERVAHPLAESFCCYRVKATVAALPRGPYTIEYCWQDDEVGREVCHREDIDVP
ncbi:MAG: hypothetical protein PVI86_05615 [Phycisphaerae bacterium]